MADDANDARDRRTSVGRSLDRGLGALEALREAFTESVEEARERGDLTTDRARELLNRSFERAREAARSGGDDAPVEPPPAEGRTDAVSRAEFEELLRRIERVEASLGLRSEADANAAPEGDDRR